MKIDQQTNIAVLYGGLSSEREVSLRTGKAVLDALHRLGYNNAKGIDVNRSIAKVLMEQKTDVAFIALHGKYGEDGTIQGLLEYLNIAYTGSGVLASSLAMDKMKSKELFRASGVLTANWFVSHQTDSIDEIKRKIHEHIGLPCICKPAWEGSTLGFCIVQSFEELPQAIDKANAYDSPVIWEPYLKGREMTVGFLNGQLLPVIEIEALSGLYDYESKYTKGKTLYHCPANLTEAQLNVLLNTSKAAFEVLNIEGVGRLDAIMVKDEFYVLEINTIPGMTETSLLPKACQAMQIGFDDMVEELLKTARLKTTVSR